MNDYFGGSSDELYYGNVRCEYFAYQDDVGKPSAGVNQAQIANTKMTSLFKEKGLTAHPDKTGYIVFGSKGYKDDIFKELEKCELSLGDFPVKRKNSDRYLGQILHTDGVKSSVEATIVDREGKLKGAIFEVKSIIEDFQMQAVGGMMAAWELWEKAMLPSLLSGAGTWMGITSTKEDKLDRIQDLFWRVMLRMPESCPKVSLRAKTRMISMKQRIWQEKLLLMRRIKSQSMETLSRKILEEQKYHNWPGLSREVSDICEKIGISDLNDGDIPVAAIKKAVFNHHYLELKEQLAKSKKMTNQKEDDFTQIQPYLKFS